MGNTIIGESAPPLGSRSVANRSPSLRRFRSVRAATERLAARLSAEDQGLQSMPSCSPAKWHRAHTTWFWEAFVLGPRGIAAVNPQYALLFNSYYEALGPRHARPKRGLLSRPSAAEVGEYRCAVDEHVLQLLSSATAAEWPALRALVELGLAHEEQHQELLLTDVLHAFSQNPLRPAYAESTAPVASARPPRASSWASFDGGLIETGAAPSERFRFDNEEPRHRVYVRPFQLAQRLVTVGEWKRFAAAGGYRNPALWLSDGWDWVQREAIEAPGHARVEDTRLIVFGLAGEHEAEDDEPLCHVSFYEADALARFFSARLPTEAEWELAAETVPMVGNFVEDGAWRALPARGGEGLQQMFGDAWEWTQSPYVAYPGYQPAAGAIGEYNGKFMANQIVLRGGSCLTPAAHMRASYRNFWPPETRFQMSGIRLARDGRDS